MEIAWVVEWEMERGVMEWGVPWFFFGEVGWKVWGNGKMRVE